MAESFFNFLSQRRPWVLLPLSWLMASVPPVTTTNGGTTEAGARDNSGKNIFGLNASALSRTGFIFRINPQRMDYSKPKSRSLELTKSGYQNTYWFEREQTLSLSGTTGAFGPVPGGGALLGLTSFRNFDFQSWMGDFTGGVSEAPFDITVSPAWQNFEALQRIFEAGTNELYSLHADDLSMYVGVVNDFSFTQDAYDPFQIRWSLVFTSLVRHRVTLSVDRVTTRDAFKYLISTVRSLIGEQRGSGDDGALYLFKNVWKAGAGDVSSVTSAIRAETDVFLERAREAFRIGGSS